MKTEENGHSKEEPVMQKASESRAQLRARQRIEDEAKSVYTQLTEKFFKYFLECDEPESDEVKDKIREFSSKWKMYCHKNNLLPKAYPIVEQYCDEVIKRFIEAKTNNISESPEINGPENV